MEIVVKVNKFDDIEKLNNASSYLLANKNFSYRYDESFSLSKIKLVKDYCIKNNKKLYVLINKIFKDEDLTSLKEFMQKLLKINVDGFYFTDFAVFMIAQELKAADKCYFYHETFLRNTYDILTYQEYGIKNIICSKDMNINDIKNLPISKKDTYGILCFGYFPLYESQRKILTNYANINKYTLESEEYKPDKYKPTEWKEKGHEYLKNNFGDLFDKNGEGEYFKGGYNYKDDMWLYKKKDISNKKIREIKKMVLKDIETAYNKYIDKTPQESD